MKVDPDLRDFVSTNNAARAAAVLALFLTEWRKANDSIGGKLDHLAKMVDDLCNRLAARDDLRRDIRPREADEPSIRPASKISRTKRE